MPVSDNHGASRRRRIVGIVAALAVLSAGATVAAVALLRGAEDDVQPGAGNADAPSTTRGSESDSALTRGRFAQLGSFRREPTAEREAARLREAGLAAVVYDSNNINELLPAFWVIVAGPLTSPESERRALEQADNASVPGSRIRLMTPARGIAEKPSESYAGSLNRRAAPGSSLNRMIGANMTFASDSQTGSVTFDTPSCESDLRISSTIGATRNYDETVTRGVCLSGGRWSVKTAGQDLLVTWWHPDRTYFVVGTLTHG